MQLPQSYDVENYVINFECEYMETINVMGITMQTVQL